jgi:hypothetical protein
LEDGALLSGTLGKDPPTLKLRRMSPPTLKLRRARKEGLMLKDVSVCTGLTPAKGVCKLRNNCLRYQEYKEKKVAPTVAAPNKAVMGKCHMYWFHVTTPQL